METTVIEAMIGTILSLIDSILKFGLGGQPKC